MIRLASLLLITTAPLLRAAEDFRPMVAEALKRGDKRIVIPPGTYRISPTGGGGSLWKLGGLKDVEIIADGVTMVGTKLIRAIDLTGSSGVTLQGLTVDYDPLPFTQGTIIAGSEDGNSIDVKLHAGYPRKPYSRIDVIDPQTRFRKKGMPFLWGTKGEMVGEDVVRIRREGIAKFAKPGDLASLSTGQEGGSPHGISVEECGRITLRNVTVFSAPGMGILEADGEGGSAFSGCRIIPGPKPAGATEERLLSSSWDAFQSKTIRRGPIVENCEIREAGDDSWSVQSSDYVILKNEGGTVILASRDEYTRGVRDGDRLRTGLEGEEYRITSRKVVPRKDAGLSEEVMERLARAKAWDPWHVSPQCIVVTLDRACPLQPGACFYSPDRMGNGFVFRGNHIHSPGRVLLKAGGLVEGNVLDTPHAMVACPELPGNAAAGIGDLVIRNNTIRNSGWFCAAPWSSQAGVISVTATAGADELRTVPVYRNVVIQDNIIEAGLGPHLVVSSAKGLIVRGNRFVSPGKEKAPDTGASYAIPKDAVAWISHSTEVKYEENKVEDPGPFAKDPVIR